VEWRFDFRVGVSLGDEDRIEDARFTNEECRWCDLGEGEKEGL